MLSLLLILLSVAWDLKVTAGNKCLSKAEWSLNFKSSFESFKISNGMQGLLGLVRKIQQLQCCRFWFMFDQSKYSSLLNLILVQCKYWSCAWFLLQGKGISVIFFSKKSTHHLHQPHATSPFTTTFNYHIVGSLKGSSKMIQNQF